DSFFQTPGDKTGPDRAYPACIDPLPLFTVGVFIIAPSSVQRTLVWFGADAAIIAADQAQQTERYLRVYGCC
ncbi:hypothetical protein, partial [Pseudoalteromonas sp. GABNS16H]|uniref:hypothetical protein n=1 Tax=Pseudoalteromonas sp. GABNS16H TaxID=3025325 RepID=UPI002360B066